MSRLRFLPWFAITTTLVSLSCSSGGSGSGSTGTDTGATAGIDGAWDITQAGDGEIGPSEMTISGGSVTGVVIDKDEGTSSGGCKALKDRTEFSLSFQGNALSGTVTTMRAYEGSEDVCPSTRNHVTPITGSRASGSAGSGLTGEWEVQVGDDKPFIVVVDGLTAKAWDKKRKSEGTDPTVNVSVAGGSATVASKNDDFGFAARRR